MDFPPFGMVLERQGGDDRDHGDGNDSGGSITADRSVNVAFPHLYDFMKRLGPILLLLGVYPST